MAVARGAAKRKIRDELSPHSYRTLGVHANKLHLLRRPSNQACPCAHPWHFPFRCARVAPLSATGIDDRRDRTAARRRRRDPLRARRGTSVLAVLPLGAARRRTSRFIDSHSLTHAHSSPGCHPASARAFPLPVAGRVVAGRPGPGGAPRAAAGPPARRLPCCVRARAVAEYDDSIQFQKWRNKQRLTRPPGRRGPKSLDPERVKPGVPAGSAPRPASAPTATTPYAKWEVRPGRCSPLLST
mmetsp:Transcript_3848/g.10826  ORF Transcript_3848/g.10826 Transcript_3848/m.10826 type:complete len:242 (-) Transcript_3848:87-812(-)